MPKALAGMLGLFALAVGAWAIFGNDRMGGEPSAVVATTPQAAAQAKLDTGGDGQQHSRHDGTAGTAETAKTTAPGSTIAPPGSKTITIIDGSSGKHQDVIVPGKSGSGASMSSGDQRLLEMTRHGAIPRISMDGMRPFTLYAHPRKLPQSKADAPRIAIIVSGLGISASGTADALSKLPAPVTLAFAPYGSDLEHLVERAKAENHEVLLQAPMEPLDYPDNDPGPETLLTSLPPDQNIDRLHWLMSRFQGYVGIISYMGGRFTASEQSLAPVLHETAKRGLIYVDDGASSRSVAGQLAGAQALPFAKADIVIDAVPTPTGIDQALAQLEMSARDHGTAVGLASALPGSVTHIAEWAKKVEMRGFVLVPITMVAVKEKSS
jgi:polysaccharide deacetylase 2 family uncharacterized protein YibQ